MTMPSAPTANEGGFRITGWHVLWTLIAFFGAVMVVNGFMMWAALTTFGGVETPSSYKAGLEFTDEMDRVHTQDALHWSVDAHVEGSPEARTVIIEVGDATLSQSKSDILKSIEALRRRGFRVGVNATRSWCTPLDTHLRLLLDSVRIDALKVWSEADLLNRIEAASACGMAVIAENARYRDGEKLASVGIELARAPRVDG